MLLASATSNPSTQPLYPPDYPSLPLGTDFGNNAHLPSPVTGINWGLYAAHEDPQVPLSPIQEALAYVAETSLQFLDGDLSEDEMVERLSVDSSIFSSGKPCLMLFSQNILMLKLWKVMKISDRLRPLQAKGLAIISQTQRLIRSGTHGKIGL